MSWLRLHRGLIISDNKFKHEQAYSEWCTYLQAMSTTMQSSRLTTRCSAGLYIPLPSTKPHSLVGSVCGAAVRSKRRQPRTRSRGKVAKVVAYQETSPIQDWRVQQMVDLCHTYFQQLWSEGKADVAEEILDPGFVHHDEVWRRSKLIVGPTAFKKFLRTFRKGYPDLCVRPVDFSTSDNTMVYVRWEGSGTNLGQFRGRKPTRHFSSLSGITSFSFNHDRSKIKEAVVYRSPTAEERDDLSSASDPLEVHLARLHFG